MITAFKRILVTAGILFLLSAPFRSAAQNVGVNQSGAAPDPSAMLDVVASDKGVLIPRVQLDDASTQAPISSAPVEGLLIYNETGTEPSGFYYWDGSQWVSIDAGGTGYNTSLVLNGNTLELTDGAGTLTEDLSSLVDDADADPTNELITSVNLNGNTLEITEAGTMHTEDLTPLVDDADADPTNELNTSLTLNGSTLELTDAGGTLTEDLSSLGGSSYWDRDATNGYLFPSNIGDRVGVGTNSPAEDVEVLDADGDGTAALQVGSTSGDRVYIGSVEYIEDAGANELAVSDDLLPTGADDLGQSGDEWEDLYLNGAIFDNTGNDGAAGDVLTSTGTGIEWQAGGGGGDDNDWYYESTDSSMLRNVGTEQDCVLVGTNGLGPSYSYHFAVDNGSASGTRIGIGSVEYLIDEASETTINNDFSPASDNMYDLGNSIDPLGWAYVYTYNTVNPSDRSIKEDIEPLDYGLEEVMKLNPVRYRWKRDSIGKTPIPKEEKEVKLGLVAQEVQPVIDEVVQTHDWKVTDEDHPEKFEKVETELMGMKYTDLIPVLIKALQEQQDQIEEEKEEKEELKDRLDQLEERLEKLEEER